MRQSTFASTLAHFTRSRHPGWSRGYMRRFRPGRKYWLRFFGILLLLGSILLSPMGMIPAQALDVPVLISPGNFSTITVVEAPPLGIPEFKWGVVAGATIYRLQVSSDIAFTSTVVDITTPNTTYTPTSSGPFSDGTWYWRVRVESPGPVGDYSGIWNFTKQWATPANLPTLIAPADSATIDFYDKPIFSWSPVTGAARYIFQVYSSPGGWATPIYNQTTLITTYQPTDKLANGTYYWRVVPVDPSNHEGTPSAEQSFIAGYNPLPTLLQPADFATPTFTPTFLWTAVRGAQFYRLQYSTDPSFNTNVITIDTRNTAYTPNSTLPNDVNYYWRVRVQSGTPISNWTTSRSFVKKWYIKSVLLTPTNLYQNVRFPMFSWTPVPGASYYYVEISWYPGFSPLYDSGYTANTFFTPNHYDGATNTFYWRVTPIDGNGYAGVPSNTSSYVSYGTSVAPQQVYPLYYYPPDVYSGFPGVVTNPHEDRTVALPIFMWDRVYKPAGDPNQGQVYAGAYRLQVSTDPTFATLNWSVDTQNTVASPTSSNPFTPLANTDYFWRVRPLSGLIGGSEIGQWSQIWKTRFDLSKGLTPTSGANPTLLRPTSGFEYAEATPLLEWFPLSGANSYDVQISLDSSFGIIVDSATVPYPNYAPIHSLAQRSLGAVDFGIYYWRVRKTGSGTAWSETRRFQISAQSQWQQTRTLGAAANQLQIGSDLAGDVADPYYDLADLQVTQSSNYWYFGFHFPVPALSLTKTDNFNPAKYDHVGQIVTYTLTATNTGTVPLHNVTVSDNPALGGFNCNPSIPAASLAPGASVVCTGTHTITQTDLDAGSFVDIANATSAAVSAHNVPDTVFGTQVVKLGLTKTDNFNPAKYDHVGQIVTYTLTATNNSTNTLHNVTVSDNPGLNSFGCNPSIPVASLAPGASVVCTGTHTITQADLNAGSFADIANASSDEATAPNAPDTVCGVQNVTFALYLDTDHQDSSGATFDARGYSVTTIPAYRPEFAIYVLQEAGAFSADKVYVYKWNGSGWNTVDILSNIGGAINQSANYVELQVPNTAIGYQDNTGSYAISLFSLPGCSSAPCSGQPQDSVPSDPNVPGSGAISRFANVTERMNLLMPPNNPAGVDPTTYPSILPFFWDWSVLSPWSGAIMKAYLDPLFTTVVATYNLTSDTPFYAQPFHSWGNDFMGDNTYYWRIQPCYNGGCNTLGVWSQGWRFERQGFIPQNLKTSVTFATPTFAWDMAEGAESYDLQVDDDPNFGSPSIDINTRMNSYTPQDTLANATYYWRVRVRRNGGVINNWTSNQTFTLALPVPSGLNSYPSGVVGRAPTLCWTPLIVNSGTGYPVLAAWKYRIQVSKDPTFSSIYDNIDTEQSCWTPTKGYDDGQYYWRVAMIDGEGKLGDFCNYQTFTKQYPITTLVSPLNGAILTLTPTFIWTPVNGAARYRLDVSLYANFSSTVDSVITDNTRYTPTGTYDTSHTYYWRVAIIDNDGRIGPFTDATIILQPYLHMIGLPIIIR